MLEVVRAIAHVSGCSFEEVEKARALKHQEKGGFDQGMYCTSIDVEPTSPHLSYYLANPPKYPEIKEN